MATVIDSLVVELGLDPKKFTAGQREAVAAAKKMQEDLLKQAKSSEEHARRTGQVFGTLRNQALGFFAALIGGAGLTAFIKQLTSTDAATGRFATSLGVSIQSISRWERAVELAGGTAEETKNAFLTMQDGLVRLQKGLGMTPLIQQLHNLSSASAAIGGPLIDPTKLKDAEAGWLAVGAALRAVYAKSGPEAAGALARDLGISPTGGLYDLLLKDPAAMLKRVPVVSPEDVKNSQELLSAWTALFQRSQDIGREVRNWVSPALLTFFNGLAQVAEAFAGSRDKDRAGPGTRNFFDKINEAALEAKRRNVPFWDVFFPSATTPAAGVIDRQGPAGRSFLKSGAAPTSPTAPAGRQTRGDRNNNPGNIEYGPFAIAHGAVGTDGRFAIFADKAAGERAMAALLGTKAYSGLTLAEIQRKWVGNEDQNYLRSMMKATGLNPNSVPNLNSEFTRQQLMRGMTQGEGTTLSAVQNAVRRAPVPNTETGAALGGGLGLTDNRSTSSSTHDVRIGAININAPRATDAEGIATEIAPAIKRHAFAAQSNSWG